MYVVIGFQHNTFILVIAIHEYNSDKYKHVIVNEVQNKFLFLGPMIMSLMDVAGRITLRAYTSVF